MAGAVLTLQRADRGGERIYNVRKQEMRGFDSIFQSSKVMAAVVREARRMAPLDAPLLIEGETGTGKELLARACHLSSPRGQSPFMALNCAGLPESMAETELRSEEHTSELQSLMRISYAVFCLKKKKNTDRYECRVTQN